MDGYAVRAADLEGANGATPVRLPVDGDIAAGDTTRHVLAPGHALRIMTGAPLPEGCDAVVAVELDRRGRRHRRGAGRARGRPFRPAPGRGRPHRRRRAPGRDPARARSRRAHGRRQRRAGRGASAAPGRRRVHRRRARAPWAPPWSTARSYDSNSLMLEALVEAAGAEVAARVHLRDDAEAVRAFLTAPDWLTADLAHHDRRGLDGRLRHGQGGAHRGRRGRVRQGRDAAGEAAGVRGRRRRSRRPGHPARQPGQLVRLVPRVRAAGAAGPGRSRPGRRRRLRRRSPERDGRWSARRSS